MRFVGGPLGKRAAKLGKVGLDTPSGKRLLGQLRSGLSSEVFNLVKRHGIRWDKLPQDLRSDLKSLVMKNSGPVAKAGQDLMTAALKKGHSLQDAVSMGAYSTLSAGLLQAAKKSPRIANLIGDTQGRIAKTKLDALVFDLTGKKSPVNYRRRRISLFKINLNKSIRMIEY